MHSFRLTAVLTRIPTYHSPYCYSGFDASEFESRSDIFFSSDRPWALPCLHVRGYESSFTGGKAARAWHGTLTLPSIAEFDWVEPYLPPYTFMACTGAALAYISGQFSFFWFPHHKTTAICLLQHCFNNYTYFGCSRFRRNGALYFK